VWRVIQFAVACSHRRLTARANVSRCELTVRRQIAASFDGRTSAGN